MKVIFTLFLSSLLIASSTKTGSMEEVVSGLRSANAAQIAKCFDVTVQLTLPERTGNFSKAEGETLLRKFFTSSNVRSFDIIHRGENNGAEYCIGTLISSAGSFRTTVYLERKADKQVVKEIRFEAK